jgi:hypothetical protein
VSDGGLWPSRVYEVVGRMGSEVISGCEHGRFRRGARHVDGQDWLDPRISGRATSVRERSAEGRWTTTRSGRWRESGDRRRGQA